MNFTEITKDEFDQRVLNTNEIVCVAFGANWSGAFYLVQPALNDFIKKSKGSIKLMLLDYDSNKWFAEQFGIHFHVPSILIFQNGVKVKQAVGITACLDLLLEFQVKSLASSFRINHLENQLSGQIQGSVYPL